MPKTWITTDTHFNHQKMIVKGYRPIDFQGRIIANWRRLISPNDTVIHLGDVICGRDSQLQVILENLPGRKMLVRGNHDKGHSASWFIESGFDFVCDAFVWRHVFFTHMPSAFLPPGCTVNVHGHLHSDGHRDKEFDLKEWHLKLSLEDSDYHPWPLELVMGVNSYQCPPIPVPPNVTGKRREYLASQ